MKDNEREQEITVLKSTDVLFLLAIFLQRRMKYSRVSSKRVIRLMGLVLKDQAEIGVDRTVYRNGLPIPSMAPGMATY